MQRAERRQAEREGRRVRTLGELDYLLDIADETRLGALRFRWSGEEQFQSPVPRLYSSTNTAICRLHNFRRKPGNSLFQRRSDPPKPDALLFEPQSVVNPIVT